MPGKKNIRLKLWRFRALFPPFLALIFSYDLGKPLMLILPILCVYEKLDCTRQWNQMFDILFEMKYCKMSNKLVVKMWKLRRWLWFLSIQKGFLTLSQYYFHKYFPSSVQFTFLVKACVPFPKDGTVRKWFFWEV